MFGGCKKESQRLRGESKDYTRNVRTIGGFYMKSEVGISHFAVHMLN